MLLVVFVYFGIILLILHYLSIRKFGYWKKRNVPYLKPLPFFGNYRDYILLKKYAGQIAEDICKRYPDAPCIGTFYGTEPALIVKDPELIKTVLTKDFYYFNSREVAEYTHMEVRTQNLFFTYGNRWKVVRQNLTPLFTSAKMRNMFYLIENCASSLAKFLDEETKVSTVLEVRSLMTRYTMECIGSAAFGVETNTLKNTKEPNPYYIIGHKIFDNSFYRGMKTIGRAMWPSIFYALGFKVFSPEVEDFFKVLLKGVFKARGHKPTNRNDFIDLILNLKRDRFITGDSINSVKTGAGEKFHLEVDDDLLIAQCIMFFAAGYETSTTTLSFTLYELARNTDKQERVIAEIDEYLRRNDGKISYECVHQLPYTEACTMETLRLYPISGILMRESVENYVLPTGLQLDKNMRIHIPIYYLHHNPDYFPEPESFRPERFLPGEKENIKPYTYMPFGEGPRICIGMRFAKMQMIAGLVTLFKGYRVEMAEDTPDFFEFEPSGIVTQPIGDINLKFIPRSMSENIHSN